ncbi:hypothetical protein B0H14DRAFT_2350321 [Mycena olivaceomarginata]|nr:hypothetical protein B0H14DRAFT_2350321 [Mycena olivaceomarginata]
MAITYGIDVLPSNDPYLELSHETMDVLVVAGVPGKYLLNAIPVLQYIPTWFPGAGFKREAQEWRKITQQSVALPFEEAKRKMVSRPFGIFRLSSSPLGRRYNARLLRLNGSFNGVARDGPSLL